MSCNGLNQLDATDLYCPDWSLPVRRFLNDVPIGERAHIVTKEKRAGARLKLICASYDWCLEGPILEDGLIHFLITK